MGFDIEALIRGMIIGLSSGFVITAIFHYILELSAETTVRFGICLTLILSMTIFYLWPSLVAVPDLRDMERSEAEQILSEKQLIPVVREGYFSARPNRVIPDSQDPEPGIRVRKGTLIRFTVSTGAGISLFPTGYNGSETADDTKKYTEPSAGPRCSEAGTQIRNRRDYRKSDYK